MLREGMVGWVGGKTGVVMMRHHSGNLTIGGGGVKIDGACGEGGPGQSCSAREASGADLRGAGWLRRQALTPFRRGQGGRLPDDGIWQGEAQAAGQAQS
jgi:hypothetical protein